MFDHFVGLALKGLKFLQKSVMDAAFRTLKDRTEKLLLVNLYRDHSFSLHAKFSGKLTYLIP